MRLVLLTALVMVAFAANSVLNRAAVGSGEIGAMSFAAIRLASGAVALWALVALRRSFTAPSRRQMTIGALSLLTYMLGFSLAYLRLDAGLGALILFGGVQITMFSGSVFAGGRPAAARWAGSAIALAGLVWILWPTAPVPVDPVFAAAMALAALGWGVYSLNGQGAVDPLGATATNFALATPVALVPLLMAGEAMPGMTGIILAVISGVITSGLGYALWYAVLPRLETTVAALSQLTVPVIAIAGGTVFLGEGVTASVLIGTALVVGGVAFGVLAGGRQRTINSRGS